MNWLLSKSSINKFDLITCLATEDRCLLAYEVLKVNDALSNAIFFEIVDPIDTKEHIKLRDNNKASILTNHAKLIEKHILLEPVDNIIRSINNFLKLSSGNIVLDISCFPKRFFFQLQKFYFHHSW